MEGEGDFHENSKRRFSLDSASVVLSIDHCVCHRARLAREGGGFSHSDTFQTNSVSTTLSNSSASLAFLIRLRVTNGGNEVLPVFWSDNYITLLPGETRTETATFNAATLPAGSIVQADGFNITPN